MVSKATNVPVTVIDADFNFPSKLRCERVIAVIIDWMHLHKPIMDDGYCNGYHAMTNDSISNSTLVMLVIK